MKPRLRRLLLIALLLLPGAALLAWIVRAQPWSSAPDEAPPRAEAAVPVVLARVTEGADNVEIDVLGSGLAARSVTLFPAVPGEVAELSFRAGQRVQSGQVLMRLVDRSQRLAVDMAAARLDAARRLMARYEATRGTGAVPGSVIDEARSGVALAELELRQAREALADRVLRAPFTGVVGLAEVEPGDRVALDTVITTIDDRRTLQVAFEAPEAYAARLQVGQPLTVGNPAFGERRFEGRIAQIDSRVDPSSRNLRLRASVPNPEDVLRPGMSFQVRLVLAGPAFAAVPELALQWDRDGSFVWAVRQEQAARVPVRPVRRLGGMVLVDGALQRDETVVVEGVQRLREGRAVAALQGAPAGGEAAPASTSPDGAGRGRSGAAAVPAANAGAAR